MEEELEVEVEEQEEEDICDKMEQLLQVTFMNLPEGNLSFLIFFSPCPYAIVIDPYCKKNLFSSDSKDCREAKAFLSCVSHITIPLCVSLHKMN